MKAAFPLSRKQRKSRTFIIRMIRRFSSDRELQAVTLRFKNDNSVRKVARQMAVNKRPVSRCISAGLKKLRQFILEES
jgi:DNA-directed RNA polymerase specialized sigma subunit